MSPFKFNRLFFTCFLLLAVLGSKVSFAQPCTGIINSFPYNQGFETNDGGWLPGGTASDWAWGTPAKTVINTAGGGNRSWMVGDLNGSAYNNGENSWLMSPCFDFSALTYPQISFKIFWETERRFDGASFQYSVDGGTNWTTLGNENSNNNCNGENWFNATGITYLGNTVGWSGNIQPNSGSCLGGSGSGAWLTAKHTLSMLSGRANVRFRFTFGAGTTCNSYDGFAIDDIQIAEAPANSAGFSSTCTNSRTVSFTPTATTCVQSYAWDFGDPGSGMANTSTASNPSHSFSSAGTFVVILVTRFVNSPPATTTKEVVIIGLTSNMNWPGRCSNTADATLQVTASGSSNPYFYNWDTNPAQTTSSISNVGPGTYTVTVSSLNACSASGLFELAANTAITIHTTITDATCAANNGAISANVSGGIAPYTYTWSNGGNTAAIQNIAAGNYSLQVTGGNGCSSTASNLLVRATTSGLKINLGPDVTLCPGQTLVLNPGVQGSYRWQDGSTATTYNVIAGGQYAVTVTDAAGCTGSDTIFVSSDCSDIYFPNAFTPNGDGSNDLFGPVGNLSSVTSYSLALYNRYGQQIFVSNDPFKKWDGRHEGGKPNSSSFVWVASYTHNGARLLRKGTVILIR
ncbi:MAG: T9SS type B sorting domain-containing protein [Chitinophagaceae bacterium]|nr:MAG: T9SS type B sorting domain-containing protein [Chitinophagaceae bacterium]